MREFADEDNWHCDICLSKESEDDDPLSQCDLCMMVVHPACYRRDLYEEDEGAEDAPWFCARCKVIMSSERGAKLDKDEQAIAIPNCFLCPDLRGAMVDLDSKEWVHHTCVNWHNEIWFE